VAASGLPSSWPPSSASDAEAQGHYFAIATLLIGSSVQIVVQRWEWVGAASGLYVPIERNSPLLSLQFHTSKVPYYLLILGFTAAGYLLVWWLRRTRSASACKRSATTRKPRRASASMWPGTRSWPS